jgi:hypothetical protein
MDMTMTPHFMIGFAWGLISPDHYRQKPNKQIFEGIAP